jgi:hypothetical protein
MYLISDAATKAFGWIGIGIPDNMNIKILDSTVAITIKAKQKFDFIQ